MRDTPYKQIAGRIASVLITLFCATRICAQTNISTTDLSQSILLRPLVLSFGGAYRAIALSDAAIQVNPAGLGQRAGTAGVGADYSHNGYTHSTMWSLHGYDGTTIQQGILGLAYDRDTPTYFGTSAGIHQFTMSYAHVLPQGVLIGTSVKGFLSNYTVAGAKAPDVIDNDFGMLIKTVPHLSLAMVVQNIWKGRDYEELPFMLSGGAAIEFLPYGRVAFDIVKNFNTPSSRTVNLYTGGELRLAEGIYARGGYGADRIQDNPFYSLGLGLEGPKLRLAFVFSQRLNPTFETYAANAEFSF